MSLHTICSNFEKYSSKCILLLTLITHYFHLTGSHDSASYSITSSSGIAPDALPFVRRLAKVFGPLVRRFVFNWSVTQHASVKEQLHCGVRFVFDKFKLQFSVILICVCFQVLIACGMQVVSHLGSYTVLHSKFNPAYWWNKCAVGLITVRGCNQIQKLGHNNNHCLSV